MAAVAVVAVVAYAAIDGSTAPGAPDTPSRQVEQGAVPDIANMSPSERANRLYVRVMNYAESGQADSVAVFAPMVMAVHEMLTHPTVDERYHFGRVAEVVGITAVARAQADTILSQSPRSLLGLVLAARAARADRRETDARAFDQRLLLALESELATGNTDYASHRAEIDVAVADSRKRP